MNTFYVKNIFTTHRFHHLRLFLRDRGSGRGGKSRGGGTGSGRYGGTGSGRDVGRGGGKAPAGRGGFS